MDQAGALQQRLRELRESFDRAFAEPPFAAHEQSEELLGIRVGRDGHAVRLAEVAALEARCTVTPLPSAHPELLGVAGVRGALVAVFDLAALLGVAGGDGAAWLLLAKGGPVAFAFAAFEGVMRVPRAAVMQAEVARGARRRDVLSREGQLLPVIDLLGLVGDLERRPLAARREDVR